MTLLSHIPAHIHSISPYVPGKPITALSRETGVPIEQIIKLASNENPLGMSPMARRAASQILSGSERYPDQFDLIAKISKKLEVTPNQVALGNGSNDVLDLAARVFLTPGTSAVMSQYAFAVYPISTTAAGARCIVVPALDYGHDLAAMAAAIEATTRLVWIANPNNPTGNFLPYPQLKSFMTEVPKDVAVVLDEAYNEYLPPHMRDDATRWLNEFPNLIITRTFSKIYGLAGLRVGYAVAAPDVVDLLNRVRQPFNVNSLALAAANAAMDDQEFLHKSYEQNQRGMAQILDGLGRMGLSYIEPHGNFVTFAVADAAQVNARLLQLGVIVRPIAGYGLPNHLRVTIGLDVENSRFLEALTVALLD